MHLGAWEKCEANMKNSMGIIFSEGNDYKLNQLTQKRSVAALPIAGRYRLIDFALSNMVNSSIINVGVPTQYNYSSLMDHLGSGSEWDLARKNYGLFILPPFASKGGTVSGGDVDTLYGIMTYIRRSTQKYVVIADGTIICNMNFCDVEKFHISSNADITLIYNREHTADPSNMTMLSVNENNEVTGLEVHPAHTASECAYMNMMVIEKAKLESIIEGCVSRGEHDLVMDVLLKNIGRMRICAFEFTGYVGRVDSLESYFKINMDLLDINVRAELFNPTNPIYTKTKDQVPAKYGEWAKVTNSLIADGCILDGEVENSIIFRGVRICKGAKVRNCIIMQDSYIHEDSELNYAVIDKNVHVRENVMLAGQPHYPVIIPKGATV